MYVHTSGRLKSPRDSLGRVRFGPRPRAPTPRSHHGFALLEDPPTPFVEIKQYVFVVFIFILYDISFDIYIYIYIYIHMFSLFGDLLRTFSSHENA